MARDALDRIETWLDQPNTLLFLPTPCHCANLSELLRTAAMGANLTTDTHIATHAIEHPGTVYSNDSDFARFEGLRWRNPLASRGRSAGPIDVWDV